MIKLFFYHQISLNKIFICFISQFFSIDSWFLHILYIIMETRISVTATDTPAVIALPSSVAIPSTSSFDLYSNSSKNHFLHASDPTIDWQGHELPNESCRLVNTVLLVSQFFYFYNNLTFDKYLSSYAVAIHNKRTGKMQLVPADLFMTRPLPHRQLTNTSVPIEDAASDRRDLGLT